MRRKPTAHPDRTRLPIVIIVTVIIAAVSGYYHGIYVPRPIISYSLNAEQKNYQVSYPTARLPIDFKTMNSGQTPAVLTFRIAATNASVSSQEADAKNASSLTYSFEMGISDTTWGYVTFYVVPYAGVTSFSVTIVGVSDSTNLSDTSVPSSQITSLIVQQTSWEKLYPQTLTYATNPQSYGLYTLQP